MGETWRVRRRVPTPYGLGSKPVEAVAPPRQTSIGPSRLIDLATAFLHPATTLHYIYDMSSVPTTHDVGRKPLASILLRALSGDRFRNLGRRTIPYSGFAAHSRDRHARFLYQRRAGRRRWRRRSCRRKIDQLNDSRSDDAVDPHSWLILTYIFHQVICILVDGHPHICGWQVGTNTANV